MGPTTVRKLSKASRAAFGTTRGVICWHAAPDGRVAGRSQFLTILDCLDRVVVDTSFGEWEGWCKPGGAYTAGASGILTGSLNGP